MFLKKFREEEVTDPKPASTKKEGAPKRILLRDLTILNPVDSINKRVILP